MDEKKASGEKTLTEAEWAGDRKSCGAGVEEKSTWKISSCSLENMHAE